MGDKSTCSGLKMCISWQNLTVIFWWLFWQLLLSKFITNISWQIFWWLYFWRIFFAKSFDEFSDDFFWQLFGRLIFDEFYDKHFLMNFWQIFFDKYFLTNFKIWVKKLPVVAWRCAFLAANSCCLWTSALTILLLCCWEGRGGGARVKVS